MITRPLWQGGLGLKELSSFNEALLAKQVRRVLSALHTLLSQIITAKYGRGKLEEKTSKHSNIC